MDDRFWCVTAVFNPAGYRSRVENYLIFRERLERQKVNLLTVELAFPGQEFSLAKDERVIQLRGGAILWQKERLLNHAISLLPATCDSYAWLDADLLLPDGWAETAAAKLRTADFLQLFESVAYLKPGERTFGGVRSDSTRGVIWQRWQYGDDWLKRRQAKKLPIAATGFAWACRRHVLPAGLYDRLICGSADAFLVDCLLGSFGLLPYWSKLTQPLLRDMEEWHQRYLPKGKLYAIDFLRMEVYHLWHGALKDRGYVTREQLFRQHDYDPNSDLRLAGHVWEWASNKPAFQQAIIDYFRSRKEDGDAGG